LCGLFPLLVHPGHPDGHLFGSQLELYVAPTTRSFCIKGAVVSIGGHGHVGGTVRRLAGIGMGHGENHVPQEDGWWFHQGQDWEASVVVNIQ
jgi:hypothetical protein